MSVTDITDRITRDRVRDLVDCSGALTYEEAAMRLEVDPFTARRVLEDLVAGGEVAARDAGNGATEYFSVLSPNPGGAA